MPRCRFRCLKYCKYSGPDTESDEESSSRGHWLGQLDFVLSCIGYGVGIGDLVRFPYVFIKNGGGAFLIPFVIFLILCGFPLFYLEVCLGQFSSQSCVPVWKICPLFKGIGWGMLIASSILTVYYVMMIVWSMYYLAMSFRSDLPWASCNNTWNTDFCIDDQSNCTVQYNISTGSEILNTTFNVQCKTAAEEYWERNVLSLSSGLEEMGEIQWHLAVALLILWIIVFLCLIRGIHSSGKVVYVTVIVPYVLLTVFLIRGATLPGSLNGVVHFINPDWKRLKDIKVWLEALIQVFFSLGPAWGGIITMASYNHFHHNCFRDAVITTIADGATGLYGGLAIACVLGYMAQRAGVHVSKVITKGPGLALIAYPAAISTLPAPQLWAVLFFITLIFLGLDSIFGMFESVSSGLVDQFPRFFNNHKIHLTAIMTVVAFLLGLPFTTQGGMYLYHILDWYAGTFCIVPIAFLECVVIAWIYGLGNFLLDLEFMTDKRPSIYVRACWSGITPFLLLCSLVSLVAHYAPPTYNTYNYPEWSIGMGIMFSIIALLPVPIIAIYLIIQTRGKILQRLKVLLSPDPSWGPVSTKINRRYNVNIQERSYLTWYQRILSFRLPPFIASDTPIFNELKEIDSCLPTTHAKTDGRRSNDRDSYAYVSDNKNSLFYL